MIDLNGVGFLLKWDQATYMPPGGAAARARQLGLIKTLAHERLSASETGRLLEAAEKEVADLAPEGFEASCVWVARRDFERAVRLPSAFTQRFATHVATSYQVWTEVRAEDDFGRVEPLLETTLELSREKAALQAPTRQGPSGHLADPLIAEHD